MAAPAGEVAVSRGSGVMRVLVTGSSGRVGRAICEHLRVEHEVVGLDRLPSATTDLVGDISDPDLLMRALRGVDAVVHVAALHAPHVGTVADAEFDRVNVQATRRLAELAAEADVRQFVFTSTTALYGAASRPDRAAAAWIDEALEPRPQTVYHRSKLAAEALLQTLAERGALAVTVLRMSRCFPEPAPLMASYRLHRGVDARDVARAHALALQMQSSRSGFRRFVVSAATPFKPEDTHELMRDAPSVLARRAPALVEAFARRSWHLPATIDRVVSPALAMNDLGWRPQHGFDEVLKMLDQNSPEVLPPRQADRRPG
jgi:nucleoside-diphosphate-sugar epimerase